MWGLRRRIAGKLLNLLAAAPPLGPPPVARLWTANKAVFVQHWIWRVFKNINILIISTLESLSFFRLVKNKWFTRFFREEWGLRRNMFGAIGGATKSMSLWAGEKATWTHGEKTRRVYKRAADFIANKHLHVTASEASWWKDTSYVVSDHIL